MLITEHLPLDLSPYPRATSSSPDLLSPQQLHKIHTCFQEKQTNKINQPPPKTLLVHFKTSQAKPCGSAFWLCDVVLST